MQKRGRKFQKKRKEFLKKRGRKHWKKEEGKSGKKEVQISVKNRKETLEKRGRKLCKKRGRKLQKKWRKLCKKEETLKKRERKHSFTDFNSPEWWYDCRYDTKCRYDSYGVFFEIFFFSRQFFWYRVRVDISDGAFVCIAVITTISLMDGSVFDWALNASHI